VATPTPKKRVSIRQGVKQAEKDTRQLGLPAPITNATPPSEPSVDSRSIEPSIDLGASTTAAPTETAPVVEPASTGTALVTVASLVPVPAYEEALPVLNEHRDAIRAAYAFVQQHERAALGPAIEVGRHLVVVRGMLGHGRWLKWVEKHCPFSVRKAQQYKRLGSAYGDPKCEIPAHLTITEALEELSVRDASTDGASTLVPVETPHLTPPPEPVLVQDAPVFAEIDALPETDTSSLPALSEPRMLEAPDLEAKSLPLVQRYEYILRFDSETALERFRDLLRILNAELSPEGMLVEALEFWIAKGYSDTSVKPPELT